MVKDSDAQCSSYESQSLYPQLQKQPFMTQDSQSFQALCDSLQFSKIRGASIALLSYGAFGATFVATGFPLDTIKTKMQIQSGFTHANAIWVAKRIWSTEGIQGFFRGCLPPLWGSAIYRGVMVGTYDMGTSWVTKNTPENGFLQTELIFGLRPMVPLTTVVACLARSCFESPIEYLKLMGQTGQSWVFADIYRGLGWQTSRTTILILPMFAGLDIARRKTEIMQTYTGTFFFTAFISGMSYAISWPLETLKNLYQSGTPHKTSTLQQRIAFLGGPAGLFRGVLPGTIAGAVGNGAGMVAMIFTRKYLTAALSDA